MKKFIRNLFIILYVVIAIFVTICLLSYNKYRVSELGEYTLVIVDSNKLEPDFKKGDLVIVDGNNKIEVGDKVFFYNTYSKNISVSVAQILEEEVITEDESTYTLEGDKTLSSEYVIGSSESVTKIPNLGTILGILESKWGFLILVVFPSLLAFLYEIWEVVTEIKESSKNDKENKSNKNSKVKE